MSQFEDILNLVDALAATQLGDVHQAVAAGKDVDEGTELGDVHDTTLVDGTDLGGRRVDDQLDLTLSLGHSATVG